MLKKNFTLIAILISLLCGVLVSAAQADDITSHKHALLIGIRHYDPDHLISIDTAENDVITLASLLERGGYNADHLIVMTNTAGAEQPHLLPTRSKISKQLSRLADNLTRDDSLIIAFSGHGVLSIDGTYYLCPFDGDLENIDSLISLDSVYKLLGDCRSTKKLLMIDAMDAKPFSNELDQSIRKQYSTSMSDMPSPPPDCAVFFSCAAGESSLPADEANDNLGPFFAAVAKGLEGDAAGADGSVTLPDVERYVMQRFSESLVHPFLKKNTAGLFTIFANPLGGDDMEKIQDLIRGDFYDQADEIVNQRLATHPNDANALAQRARLMAYRAEQFRDYSQMDEALELAYKSVTLAPNEALPYLARANVLRMQKKYEQSFADSQAAVQRDPNCVMAYVVQAFALHHLHDLEGMARAAKKGMEIDPEYPEARATYVAYLFAKGELDEGHSQLDRAIAITDNMPALYFLKGYGFEKQGKHQEAVDQYSRAIELNDQIPGYLCRRALSLAHGGRVTEAYADIARAEQIAPNYVDIASARAMVIQKLQGYGHSDASIAAGLKASPESADLWTGRGYNYYSSRDFDRAVDSFENALKINPGYGEAHMGIGMVRIAQRRWDDALVHLNRATRHKEHLGRAYFEKSEVYKAKGDYAASLAELEKAIKYEPENAAYQQQRSITASRVRL